MFERSGGHARRQHHIHIERRPFRIVEHKLYAADASDIGDFVRIGNDGRHAMRENDAGEFARGHHRRFDMHVSVNQPRAYITPFGIDRFPSLIAADADDHPFRNGEIPFDDFARKHVDDFPVFDNEIRFGLFRCGG
ncbi:hypothetical protein I656_02710 [Geobacillus sp. WSUCF1]|nr:hypothetical protein I656_02710 [Geobacillus sp. WSUCF1]